jgi:hypothetical protein
MVKLMGKKPTTAAGYSSRHAEHVRATCLYMATKLGDLLDDTVIIGGLVPSLLIDQRVADELHVGTMDLDVGLSLAIFDEEHYQDLTERLRRAGFTADENEEGKPTRQRWKIDGEARVTVDFLIAPNLATRRGASRTSNAILRRSSPRDWLSHFSIASASASTGRPYWVKEPSVTCGARVLHRSSS